MFTRWLSSSIGTLLISRITSSICSFAACAGESSVIATTWAPIGRWADPREQAKAVLYLMRDATFSVGTVLVTDGGYTTL